MHADRNGLPQTNGWICYIIHMITNQLSSDLSPAYKYTRYDYDLPARQGCNLHRIQNNQESSRDYFSLLYFQDWIFLLGHLYYTISCVMVQYLFNYTILRNIYILAPLPEKRINSGSTPYRRHASPSDLTKVGCIYTIYVE